MTQGIACSQTAGAREWLSEECVADPLGCWKPKVNSDARHTWAPFSLSFLQAARSGALTPLSFPHSCWPSVPPAHFSIRLARGQRKPLTHCPFPASPLPALLQSLNYWVFAFFLNSLPILRKVSPSFTFYSLVLSLKLVYSDFTITCNNSLHFWASHSLRVAFI